YYHIVIFFFSSRRRHTRFDCDWSSDVCSSDLFDTRRLPRDYFQLEAIVVTGQATGVERLNLANSVATVVAEQLVKTPVSSIEVRSEERRVGKECRRWRWAERGEGIDERRRHG